MEATKKEYIDKLKLELDAIKERNDKDLMENAMVGEDYRSRAAHNLIIIIQHRQKIAELDAQLLEAQEDNAKKDVDLGKWIVETEILNMDKEEFAAHFLIQTERKEAVEKTLAQEQQEKKEFGWKIDELEKEVHRLKVHVDTADVECQTVLTESYFKNKDRGGSQAGSRNSGAGSSARSNNLINRAKAESRDRESRERESGNGSQRIGGGGVIRKPSNATGMTGSRGGSRGFDMDS